MMAIELQENADKRNFVRKSSHTAILGPGIYQWIYTSNKTAPYDNSVCESFFHTMKKEAIYHHMYSSQANLKKVIEEHLTFYNSQRPQRKLGMEIPIAFEAGFYNFQKSMKHRGRCSFQCKLLDSS